MFGKYIKVDEGDFANLIINSLTDKQMLRLIEDFDENACNWDFTHKAYMYFRSVILADKDEYLQFLEDNELLEDENFVDEVKLSGPTIERIIDKME